MNCYAHQMVEEKEWPISWPDLNLLLGPIIQYIVSIHVQPVMGATRVVIRFENDYGVSIFRSDKLDNMFFEITPLRFYAQEISEYVHYNNSLPLVDLDWGYAKDDILEFCTRISLL